MRRKRAFGKDFLEKIIKKKEEDDRLLFLISLF